jgi:Vitamin K-dependent gamma-carboxylase
VPSPPRGADPSGRDAGWFAPVPAYRLASFRIALAVTTVALHVPKINGFIATSAVSSFHVPPAFAWLPLLPPFAGAVLPPLQYAAAAGLLLGVWPRVSAWLLVAVGAWVTLLDPQHYSHNAHFHLTLLALAGCSSDGLSLRRLLRDDDASARCPAWPEHLVRLQVAIVFFYAALDKVFSPFWGATGPVFSGLRMADHGFGLGMLQSLNRRVLGAIPGVLSVATILTEFFLAAVALVPRLWPVGLLVGLGFVVSIEFLLAPGLFAWDLLVAGLVFLPAGDRGWTVMYSPSCADCRRNRAILSLLDWLRRLRWVAIATPAQREAAASFAEASGMPRIHLRSPRDRAFRGLGALRALPLVLAPPVVVLLVVARFGGGFLAARGYGPWDDLPFLLLGAYLASWLAEIGRGWIGARGVSVARGCAHDSGSADYS